MRSPGGGGGQAGDPQALLCFGRVWGAASLLNFCCGGQRERPGWSKEGAELPALPVVLGMGLQSPEGRGRV